MKTSQLTSIDMMTLYDKLKSLANAKQYLKPEMSFQILDDFAFKISDNKSAEQIRNARLELFNLIFKSDKTA